MPVIIRPAIPTQDFESVAAILSIYENERITAAQLTEIHKRSASDDQIHHQIVAETDGTVVGFGNVFRTPWMKPDRYFVKVWTHPDRCSQGIGTQLFDAAVGYAQSNGATSFESNVFDNDPHALRFAQAHGFKIQRHLFESRINLATFDMSPFDQIIEQVKANGIRLFTLADVGKTKENLHKLWEVNYATYMDDPGNTGTYPNFEDFLKLSQSEWFNPNSQFLAADGDQYIGLSAIRYEPEYNTFYNMMTGVMPAYRGRKIALALKLMTIAYAKQQNSSSIHTDNDSQNAPILAINRKLGYKPEPGVYRLSTD
ncbi:MAG: GNAT family N-acetyltransferase [Anaerolineae bacterium]|nr:GNAT family N-acetyltransferase [Anaerolineae bacterium]